MAWRYTALLGNGKKDGWAGRQTEVKMFHRENRRQYFGRLIADSERQKDRTKSRKRKRAKK